MGNNTAFSGLFDASTGCREFSATPLTAAGGASGVHAPDTTKFPAYIDLAGAGAPLGDTGRQIGFVLASVDLKVVGWDEGTAGTMEVRLAFSTDGSTTAKTTVIKSFSGASPTAWRERIPFTNELQGTKYRYVQVQVRLAGTGAEAQLGWHVTADSRLT